MERDVEKEAYTGYNTKLSFSYRFLEISKGVFEEIKLDITRFSRHSLVEYNLLNLFQMQLIFHFLSILYYLSKFATTI